MTFDEALPIFNEVLALYRGRWTLSSLPWEDVAQKIRIRAFKKFHLYDQAQPLKPWCARLIQHAISNELRDNYYIYKPPCLKCPMHLGDGHCKMFQDLEKCSLYANFLKNKKNAENIHFPVSYEAISYDSNQNFSYDAGLLVDAIYKTISGIDAHIFDLFHASGFSYTKIARQTEISGMAFSRKFDFVKKSIDKTEKIAANIIEEKKISMGFGNG